MNARSDQMIRWPVVLAALAGGIAAAMQVGKVGAVMPLLRAEFGASLTAVSAYLAMISLGAGLLGLTMGLTAQRAGVLRAGLAGLVLLALASLGGALAPDWRLFFAARLVEALGLPLVVAAMPALIQSACGPARAYLGMGIWSTWLPAGIALVLVASVALVGPLGWRGLYLFAALVPALAALALVLSRPVQPPRIPASAASGRPPPGVLAFAALFLLFSGSYLTVTGFLPSVAATDLGLALNSAALLAAVAALLIIAGNALATVLLVRGARARPVLAWSFAVMGICAALLLAGAAPVWLRILAGVVFHLAAGVVPGVIWASVAVLSRRLGIGAALISGCYYQAAGLGQVAAPVLAGVSVDALGGWWASLLVIGPAMALAVWLSRQGPGLD